MTNYISSAFSLSMLPPLSTESHLLIRRLSDGEAKKFGKGQEIVSAVGHEATAALISSQICKPVPASRQALQLQAGDKLLVFQLSGRLPEGKVLNAEELAQIPHSWFLVSLRIDAKMEYKYIECRWCHNYEDYSDKPDKLIHAWDLRDSEYIPESETLLAIHLDCEDAIVDKNMREDWLAGFTVRECTNCKHWEAYHDPSCDKLFWDPVFERVRSCGCTCSTFR